MSVDMYDNFVTLELEPTPHMSTPHQREAERRSQQPEMRAHQSRIACSKRTITSQQGEGIQEECPNPATKERLRATRSPECEAFFSIGPSQQSLPFSVRPTRLPGPDPARENGTDRGTKLRASPANSNPYSTMHHNWSVYHYIASSGRLLRRANLIRSPIQ
ncbi:unnamed protein product [Calypogeia fissa]